MAHTKGPWLITVGSMTNPNTVFVTDDVGDVIAILDTRSGQANQEEKLANARLIAAAPELYEALQQAQQDLIAHHGIRVYSRNFGCIDAALAKAGGK